MASNAQLRELAENLEGLWEILTNLCEALDDKSLDARLVGDFGQQLIAFARSHDPSAPDHRSFLQNRVFGIVFDNITRFQCQAPLAGCDANDVVTFTTLGRIGPLVEDIPGLKDELTDAGAPEECFNSSNVSADAESSDCVALAAAINQVCGARSDFYLSQKTAVPDLRRIVWFTYLSDLEARIGRLERGHPSDSMAYRIRNLLGLGHVNRLDHLFAFRSTVTGAEICTDAIARPTAFDGIDHRWFKHRCALRERTDRWGRTLDLEALPGPDRLDGGWEAVLRAPEFKGKFECQYVGRVIPPPNCHEPDWKHPVILNVLLNGRQKDEIIEIISHCIDQDP